MPVLSATPARSLDARLALRLLVLLGGALNGFAAVVAEAWHTGGTTALTLGIAPLELIAVAVGAQLLVQGSAAESRAPSPYHGIPELLAAVALMVPSSAVAWLVVAVYGAYVVRGSSGDIRAGAGLFLALALASLWSSVGLKAIAGPVMAAEAALVGQLLALVKSGVVTSGNVVGVPHDHAIVIMAACSTLDGLPKVLVGLTAVALFAGGLTHRQLIAGSLALTVVYSAANLFRLTAMAYSKPFYDLGHGPIGSNLFDGGMVLAVVTIVLLRPRP